MTKWGWDLPKFDGLKKMDFRKLSFTQCFGLFVILLNLLSLLVNAIAGNLLWVVVALVMVVLNIFVLEWDLKDKV